MEPSGEAVIWRVLKIILLAFAIFIVLVALLFSPAPSRSRRAFTVIQHAQLHSFEAALAIWASEVGTYPPSDANDPNGVPYCGAMKLCEALMGRDLMGFHPHSAFRADCKDKTGTRSLYSTSPEPDNLKARQGPYLPPDRIRVCKLSDIYGVGRTGPFDGNLLVICDVFARKHKTGIKTGMPILYYNDNPVGTILDANDPDNSANIFNYRDNQALLVLGVPWDSKARHPLADPPLFYKMARDHELSNNSRHVRPYKGLLISAGLDGLYGTNDDIWAF